MARRDPRRDAATRGAAEISVFCNGRRRKHEAAEKSSGRGLTILIHAPSLETSRGRDRASPGAEGETAPETLKQMDRARR
jgi:hypothetical protein